MKAIFLTADGFEDSELFYPYYRLLEEQVEIDIAAPKAGSVTGKHGYSMQANLSLDDVQGQDYDLLVLPGGSGPEKVRLNENARKVARHFMEEGKLVASICHGIQTLISAGVVDGRGATCWEGVQDDLRAAGADVRDEPVIVDDNLITSRCPDDLPAFGRAIVFHLAKSGRLKTTLRAAKESG